MTNNMPKVLIEDWLPIELLGVESKRERGASSALPPLYFLHVWWARKPLTPSRAAILGGILPEWSNNWPEPLSDLFPTEDAYQKWFIHLTGIRGDPVKGRKLIDWAKTRGVKLDFHPYGGAPRAFTVNPSSEDLQIMRTLLVQAWGEENLKVLDPFSGGGSIPFESLRYGLDTFANDLNPVAVTVLKSTLDFPFYFGVDLTEDIQFWGARWIEKVKEELDRIFPKKSDESIFAYLWSHTVACPSTGKTIPLSPNWWLDRSDNPIAVKIDTGPDIDYPHISLLQGNAAVASNPEQGTVSGGIGRSPWTGEVVPGDYIKAEAQAGRMGQLLYAIAFKKSGSFEFRVPEQEDLQALNRAEDLLAQKYPLWIATDLLPSEEISNISNYNRGHRLYGIYKWTDFFSPRQLLSAGVYLEKLREIQEEILAQLDFERAKAILTLFAIALDKALIYNTRASRFDPSRGVRSIFDRHNFAFLWSFAEFDAAENLLPWVLKQTEDAYKGIAKLGASAQDLFTNQGETGASLNLSRGSASNLAHIPDNSIVNITVDPPYYDNVIYAELSDFFYVWLKRSIGHLYPELFTDELTNKDDEAIANPARFVSMGRKKKELAEQDYERKMASAFREMHRVLHPHGVLTVMFTHKRVEAWDTLASALIGAGFTIKASWPVHTESEHSLHQAKKNAAASTILLVCRKRDQDEDEPVWWDDLQSKVRREARTKAQEYAQQGISGVDLYISTFGPTLSVISQQWPVLTSEIDPKTGEPKPLRPETALDLAREEVVRLRKEGLLAGRAIEFDPVTDWYIMAWDAFQAEQFPFDEARKLAIALGLEMDDLLGRKKLVTKKGQYVVLQKPKQRRKKGMVDSDAAHFEHHIDALHTAMLIYEEDGAGACDVFLQNRGLKRDTTFRAGLQALINAIPRTKVKNKFVRPEADVLDRMRLAFYADELTVPPEEEPPMPQAQQLGFSFDAEEYDEDEDEEELDDEE